MARTPGIGCPVSCATPAAKPAMACAHDAPRISILIWTFLYPKANAAELRARGSAAGKIFATCHPFGGWMEEVVSSVCRTLHSDGLRSEFRHIMSAESAPSWTTAFGPAQERRSLESKQGVACWGPAR